MAAATTAAAVVTVTAPSATAGRGPRIGPTLVQRATLSADYIAPGPPSGALASPANGRIGPFPGQVIPGFSAIVDNGAFTDDPLRRRRATRVYAALLGQVPGVDLVSAPLRADMAAPAFEGRGRGHGHPDDVGVRIQPAATRRCHRPGVDVRMIGANGSAAYADIDSGVAVAVMHNRLRGPCLFVSAAWRGPRHRRRLISVTTSTGHVREHLVRPDGVERGELRIDAAQAVDVAVERHDVAANELAHDASLLML